MTLKELSKEAMKKAIKPLNKGIRDAIQCGDSPEEKSWSYQRGVLISINEAKALVHLMNKVKAILDDYHIIKKKDAKIKTDKDIHDSYFRLGKRTKWLLLDKDEGERHPLLTKVGSFQRR